MPLLHNAVEHAVELRLCGDKRWEQFAHDIEETLVINGLTTEVLDKHTVKCCHLLLPGLR